MDLVFHTDCYSNKVIDILTRWRDYNLQHCRSKAHLNTFAIARIDIQTNGEVTWTVNKDGVCLKLNGSSYSNSYSYQKSTYFRKGNSPQKIKEWMAIMLKDTVMSLLQKEADKKFNTYVAGEYEKRKKWVEDAWDRDNYSILEGFSGEYSNAFGQKAVNQDGSISVADVYCLYDKLLNRKRLFKSYTKKQIAKIIGAERDPFATELENIRREEAAKLKRDHELALAKITGDRRLALETAQQKIYAEFTALENEEKAAYKIASENLVNSLAFAQTL